VLALANVIHFLADEFTSLGGRRLSFPLIAHRPAQRLVSRHTWISVSISSPESTLHAAAAHTEVHLDLGRAQKDSRAGHDAAASCLTPSNPT
jgi:hypothetical protein